MGLFDKLKNVLFEEEEVEIPIITKTEKESEDFKSKRKFKENKREIEEFEEEASYIKEEPKNEEINKFRNLRRDIDLDDADTEELDLPTKEVIKQEKSSPFLSFDEDEFERLNNKVKSNEKERTMKKDNHKKNALKEEKKEDTPINDGNVKFRPSPIISPVYGILDKNYKKEDIIDKSELPKMKSLKSLDVDSVRRKAFGTLEDEIEDEIFKDNVFKVVDEEDLSDSRSIDEMLKESIDETIIDDEDEDLVIENTIEDELDEPVIKDDSSLELPTFEEIMEEERANREDTTNEIANDILEKTNTLKILDDIEKELNEVDKKDDKNLEDTTETDLFNLIDSMYEDEEGEE